jgi:uncharacterized protein (DUF1800 family)
MTLSRRAFLKTAATLPMLTAVTACGMPLPTQAALPETTPLDLPPPPSEIIALNRMTYGQTPELLAYVRKIGLKAYINEQLQPKIADDPAEKLLRNTTLHISYEGEGSYATTDEARPLQYLDATIDQLWHLQNWDDTIPYAERYRPLEEMRTATWIRAVSSRWQLREVLVDFWHNHFNVNAENDDVRIAATWPLYDRDVIRRHALGNFRQFLEAVATSMAMLCYLNNASSQASPANENYARELLELHTLGATSYLRGQYNHWRDVPGAKAGLAHGYIDEDVYEVARAFTGWTIADGDWDGSIPNTGEFYYRDQWHDPYQKRVLGIELDSHQPPMADGRMVLDIIANHPATARFICTKLCRRLVADQPPERLIQRAVDSWMNTTAAPDQIAQVVRVILTSAEFGQDWGKKIRRPFEHAVAFIRSSAGTFQPSGGLDWLMHERGQRLFSWPAPNGFPDVMGYWLSSSIMIARWSIAWDLQAEWLAALKIDWVAQTPSSARSARQISDYWLTRLLGHNKPSAHTSAAALALISQQGNPNNPPSYDDDDDRAARIASLVHLISMAPEYQYR